MADKIQIILKEDVPNLGTSGELVAVRPGYGRNYLIPQGLAVVASRKNVAQMEHEKSAIAARAAKQRKDNETLAGSMKDVSVEIARPVGEGDKLFGSVTTRDIEEALAAKGHKVDRKKIALAEPIKTLGKYVVELKIARDVTAQINVSVVAKS
jgi:large subunit ribosomal protein L9